MSKKVWLIWKRSDPWAKKLGQPRQETIGTYWSSDEAHEAIPAARRKLLSRCKTDDERSEIEHGSWWTTPVSRHADQPGAEHVG